MMALAGVCRREHRRSAADFAAIIALRRRLSRRGRTIAAFLKLRHGAIGREASQNLGDFG